MRRKTHLLLLAIATLFAASGTAMAQAKSGPAISGDQPIEITADTLDVHQDEHKAIFSGNVIATQGTTNLRSKTMTAFYNQDDKAKPDTTKATAPKAAEANGATGISRIDADDNVVFTTPAETAQGDKAVYTAADDTIVLTGATVTLTRDKNVLKGQKLVYNMSTGRSVLTSSSGVQVDGVTVGKPGRVHGLFVPKSDKKAQ